MHSSLLVCFHTEFSIPNNFLISGLDHFILGNGSHKREGNMVEPGKEYKLYSFKHNWF